jgi:hypothetical protein
METSVVWAVQQKASDAARVLMFAELAGRGYGQALLDLGAGPCIFARWAQKHGWKVTAVDARTDWLPEDLDGVTFVQSDVRDFDPSGFGTIANLGLLYHLTIDDQLALLRACSHARVILETQVHTPGVVPPRAEAFARQSVAVRPRERSRPAWLDSPRFRQLIGSPRIGPALTRQLARAAIFTGVEYDESASHRSGSLRASVGNSTSFWPTEESLLAMFEACGYRSVKIVEPPVYSVWGTRKFYVLNSLD